MPERPLTPANHDDLVQSLAYALRDNRSGKRVNDRELLTATIAAEHLAETLRLSGFVVMKKPPLQAHTAALPPHAIKLMD